METFHFSFEEGFHFGEFFGVSGVLGEVSEVGIFFTVFGEKLVGVLFEIEELGFADGAVEDVEFHELPVAFSDGAHPRLGASGVDSEEGVADGLLFASENGFETRTFVGCGGFNSGEIAESGEGVHEVDVALHTAFLDAGAGDDVGDAPGVLIEVLFPLESVAADGHAVVGGVDDVGVVEFPHRFKFFEDLTDLDVDVFGAGEFAAEFVADGGFIAVLPNARN